jgi:hypothetical protein
MCRVIGAQIMLYDIDDWKVDNSRALSLARRLVSRTRLIPLHEFENLDGFVSSAGLGNLDRHQTVRSITVY